MSQPLMDITDLAMDFNYQHTGPLTHQRPTTQITAQETEVDPRCLTKQTGTITPLESRSGKLNPKPPVHRDTETAINGHSTPITASVSPLKSWRRREGK